MRDKKPHSAQEKNYDEGGARLYSPSAGRNHADITAQLANILPENAAVLEIASGTGEHALSICRARPDILWQPSDPNADARISQNAWAEEASGRMLPSKEINTMDVDWAADMEPIDALFCANMIHIAPWEAALGLAAASSALIKPVGMVILYGPFKEGAATAESNLSFDASLKSRNPSWGVRDLSDVKHIFAKAGFNDVTRIVMPKNNQILVFKRSST